MYLVYFAVVLKRSVSYPRLISIDCSLFGEKNLILNSESAKMVEIGRLVFVPVSVGALREAHFRRPRAKREKKKSAGAEKKERPPERATEIKLLKEKLSATPKALVLF